MSSHLGNIINSTITQNADIVISSSTNQGSVTVPTGTYILTVLFGLKYTTAPTLVGIYLTGIPGPQFPFGIPNQNTGTITCSASVVVKFTASSIIELFVQYTGGSGLTTLASNIFTATRIG